MLKSFIRFVFRTAYPLALLFWFVFRPKTAGAKVLVVSGDGVLLVKQSYTPDVWSLPGGRIEKGETPEEAARRELVEECAIEPTDEPMRLLGSVLYTKEYKRDTVFLFACEIASQEPPTLDMTELMGYQWFPLAILPNNLGSIARDAVELYQRKTTPRTNSK